MRRSLLALPLILLPAFAWGQNRSEDEYTRYELLAPETAAFKIIYDVTAVTPGARFYFTPIRKGSVAIETHVPQRGALVIETLHDHELVGWSWLVPPYRTQFDVRANGPAHTIAFDGACLRGKCDADPLLGYELLRRFSAVLLERLQATRIRLIDVYGQVPGG